MTNKQEKRKNVEDIFPRPSEEWDRRRYDGDSQEIAEQLANANMPKLERITEKEAVGMAYIGSLDAAFGWNNTMASWINEGRYTLASRFKDRVEAMARERPTPTHYSLDIRLEHSWSNCVREWRAFANFYRDNQGKK